MAQHKARVFASAMGLTAAHAGILRSALLDAAASGDVRPPLTDQFGERQVLEFQMRGPTGTAVVVSTWIVLSGEQCPG